jgi:hypothetical protein
VASGDQKVSPKETASGRLAEILTPQFPLLSLVIFELFTKTVILLPFDRDEHLFTRGRIKGIGRLDDNGICDPRCFDSARHVRAIPPGGATA